MLLADAARHQNTQPATLLEEFPGLFRRQATFPERGVLSGCVKDCT
jgi:hypothetical protein